ncbi:hypothetical protein [Amycolatopsis sp.]|uniref:hypothetical protein n=1 Tax=Amycolatopsis sp. TaxID=37632 RepID=UPI002B80C9AF|nr:hypothetical protein [Amycolatopsis sp.]HVV12102.1 hypothetical protein [Amycolatopsis sp.]
MVNSHRRGSGGHLRAWTILVAGAALLVTACSTNSATGPSTAGPTVSASETTSAAPTTVSTADEARQQATAAYIGMWQAMAKAGVTSDWQSPDLAKYATGDALGVISRSLYTDHLNGVVTKGAPTNNPQVSSVDPSGDPTTVMISDCGDSTNSLKYKDGHLLNDTPGGKRAITAEVKKQPDRAWRVTRFAVEGLGSCA